MRLGQFEHIGVKASVLVGESGQEVEAVTCEVVILVGEVVGERFGGDVANPQAAVALGAGFIYGWLL